MADSTYDALAVRYFIADVAHFLSANFREEEFQEVLEAMQLLYDEKKPGPLSEAGLADYAALQATFHAVLLACSVPVSSDKLKLH